MKTSWFALPLVFLFLAACGQCSRDEAPEIPEIPEPAEGSATTAGAGQAAEEQAPARPAIVHDAPPESADVAFTRVEGDWTQQRGDAHRSGVRVAPSIRTPSIAWSIEVGIQGYANTPVLYQGGVYVSSQGDQHNMADERDGVYALDPETGAILWHFRTPQDANGMAIYGGTLIVGTDHGTLHAISPADGAELWNAELKCPVIQPPSHHDGQLYLLRREGWITVSLADGTVEGDVESCLRSERGVVIATEERLIRAPTRDVPSAFTHEGDAEWEGAQVTERSNGRGRWQWPLMTSSLMIQTVHRWPRVDDAGTTRHAPAVVARWLDNGQVAWVWDLDSDALAEPLDEGCPDFQRSAPFAAGERLFMPLTNGPHVAVADIKTGAPLGSVELPDCRCRQFAAMVGTEEVGYLARHDGLLYGIDLATLEVLWSVNVGMHGVAGTRETHNPIAGGCTERPKDGTALFSTPAIAESGRLYVGSGDGWIYAVDPS